MAVAKVRCLERGEAGRHSLIEIKAVSGQECILFFLSEEAHMDPLTSAGLVVAIILVVAAGYYIVRPEKK